MIPTHTHTSHNTHNLALNLGSNYQDDALVLHTFTYGHFEDELLYTCVLIYLIHPDYLIHIINMTACSTQLGS